MIDFLTGRVVEKDKETVVLAVGGLGFRLFVPPRTLEGLKPGQELRLHTHLLFQEDEFSLYGFATPEEREMFVALLSVPQVGPRLAFKLVAALPPAELVAAIRRGDLSALDAVKGIGRRTAQRVLLELSERAQRWAPPAAPPETEKEKIVLQALTSKALGFRPEEARRALELVRQECPEAPVEEMLRRALALLAGS
ncbi:MAG: Holliday junction branch migration protein RuvA [Candidatus Bipolaricaulota bacterium]|nr:Holliday junction branch migration protein RuvA [Candidatus Bipolaricaulota bacterium]MCX7843992.1 Holliday junction branch migration protein RuvA [Candidatus Bipolaricaulota bacterium]MDW8151746.1 Holliday junction branch migration protein RuvA [Candidatus Bipolaricaulota bacterium]